jgi:hypothetical protein
MEPIGPTRHEIILMKLDGLRPLVQVRLGLEEWPGDWAAAGQILDNAYFNFQRAKSGEQLFGITLFGERVNGTGIDETALVAIFRAYLLQRMEEDEINLGL